MQITVMNENTEQISSNIFEIGHQGKRYLRVFQGFMDLSGSHYEFHVFSGGLVAQKSRVVTVFRVLSGQLLTFRQTNLSFMGE